MIGTHIGNFRIVTEIGSGAMGQVYFAEHTLMGRRAAVKVIRPELSANAEMVDRFMNEARTVNAVGHPNIVEITDFGKVDDRYYIVMELLDGETLEERIERKGVFDTALAVHVTLQVADALGAVHALGVVHRDLKPENVYLTARSGHTEFVKLLDFGIAKLMTLPDRGGRTRPGTIMGTPQYMSPEQCLGDVRLDHRSDIYSLGCMMYRMLTGSLPFEADNLTRCLIAHVYDTPRAPRELRPELEPHIEAVILRALEKDPDKRFADMRELALALRAPEESNGLVAASQPSAAELRESAPRPSAAELSATVRLSPPPLPARTPIAVRSPVPAAAPSASSPVPVPLVPEHEIEAAAQELEAEQPQRVANKLARIVIDRVNNEKLKLPTMPHASLQCLELLRDPNHSASKLAEALGSDPLLVPQIIRHASSVLVSGNRQVRTLEQAIGRMGARQLRSLLLELSAQKLFQSRNPAIRRAFSELWDHSIAVAHLSRTVAVRSNSQESDVAYLAGLLHDVGKPIAAVVLLEAERIVGDQVESWLASKSWLDVVSDCHREVGVALARAWRLPDEVVVSIARSDRYSRAELRAPVNAVCLANALVKRAALDPESGDVLELSKLIDEGAALFGFSDEIMTDLAGSLTTHATLGKTVNAAAAS